MIYIRNNPHCVARQSNSNQPSLESNPKREIKRSCNAAWAHGSAGSGCEPRRRTVRCTRVGRAAAARVTRPTIVHKREALSRGSGSRAVPRIELRAGFASWPPRGRDLVMDASEVRGATARRRPAATRHARVFALIGMRRCRHKSERIGWAQTALAEVPGPGEANRPRAWHSDRDACLARYTCSGSSLQRMMMNAISCADSI